MAQSLDYMTATQPTKMDAANPFADIASRAAGLVDESKAEGVATRETLAGLNQQYVDAGRNADIFAEDTRRRIERESAYNILNTELASRGLSALEETLKGLIQSGASEDQYSIELRNTPAYKARFSANEARIAKGLTALDPATYIGLEDKYQTIMRNYGMPESYYAKDSTGKQAGFDQFIANDVSSAELEDRILTAQNRVLKANPEVSQMLKTYYPDITNGDILAYTLDPKNALNAIKQKVTAAEIGGAALQAGLMTDQQRAEALRAAGVSGQLASQNYGTIAQLAQRGSQLADIYNQGPYGQTQAENEMFNLAGQTDAANKRKKLTALETAAFSGQSGSSSGALSRDRAISPMMIGTPGAGQI